MILDVTRKPLLILPDEVSDSVVVRSLGNRNVTGLITYTVQLSTVKSRTVSLDPGASLRQGEITCFETRLLLPGSRRPKDSPYADMNDYAPRYRARYEFEHEKKEPVQILPEPFEVASVYRDPVTRFMGTWRVGMRIEKHQNGKTWLVTAHDPVTGMLLCTVAVRGLDPNPQIPDVLPLTKATRNKVATNAWERIMEDDD